VRDPRLYQIATLALLLGYGLARLGFDVPALHVVLILSTALLAQLVFTRTCGLPRFDPRSALISGLSLCLLLRTGRPSLVVAATLVTIASKFLLRWKGKHVFNPTNFGLVAMMALTGGVWVSPGQWGHSALFALLMACLGGLVVYRAWRSDVTAAFLASYAALLVGRALWLGDPLSIPYHQLQSGALLLFSFFMISDPKTTPDSRAGRVLFAMLVAAGAWYVQFGLFRPNGMLWSLAVCSAGIPLLDRLLPARRYDWASKGAFHGAQVDLRSGDAGPRRGGEGRLRLLRLLRGQG
jgi:Na+-transporting NADH:ubiquinone oxidoreductase subunit NqrB